MEIRSLTNAKVKQWASYKEKKYRDRDRRFLIEGEHLVQEAMQAGVLETVLVAIGQPHTFTACTIYEVSEQILKKLSSSVSGTWIMGVCRMQEPMESFGNKLIVLDDVQDPGNVGTIIRTAYAFGYDAVLLSKHCADVYNEKVVRSTQGALFHIPVVRGDVVEMLISLKQQGICIWATALHDAMPLPMCEKKERFALVFGNEGNGVSQEVLALADASLYIEMKQFESLNVATAAGICMYELR